MSSLYYAAACQTDLPCPEDRREIARNTRRMCQMIEQTLAEYEPFFDIRLLAFPEFAHAAPIHDSAEKLRRQLAIPVPNEHTEQYARLCEKYGCYIQTGSFLEADPDHPDVVFNTTALIGPSGLLSKYRKVNPWLPWEVHASPHDLDKTHLAPAHPDEHPLTLEGIREGIRERIRDAKRREGDGG